MIGGFRSIFLFVFHGLLPVTIVMIDDSEKCDSEGKGWLLNFRVHFVLKSTVMPFWTVTCTLDKFCNVLHSAVHSLHSYTTQLQLLVCTHIVYFRIQVAVFTIFLVKIVTVCILYLAFCRLIFYIQSINFCLLCLH